MPRFGGSASRGFGASGGFPGGRGSAVAILDYAAQERIVAQYLYEHAGVPTDGTNGTYAHVALPGALLIDIDAKTLYQNTGTQASPVWTERAPSGSGVQVATVPISSAALLALHTTPVELVPAPTAGKCLIPVTVYAHSAPGETPYDATDVQLAVTFLAGGPLVILNNNLLTQVGPRMHIYSSSNWDDAFGLESIGSPIVLACDPATPITLGDGTLDITIVYGVSQ
jgi:hypothetical protein